MQLFQPLLYQRTWDKFEIKKAFFQKCLMLVAVAILSILYHLLLTLQSFTFNSTGYNLTVITACSFKGAGVDHTILKV